MVQGIITKTMYFDTGTKCLRSLLTFPDHKKIGYNLNSCSMILRRLGSCWRESGPENGSLITSSHTNTLTFMVTFKVRPPKYQCMFSSFLFSLIDVIFYLFFGYIYILQLFKLNVRKVNYSSRYDLLNASGSNIFFYTNVVIYLLLINDLCQITASELCTRQFQLMISLTRGAEVQ